MLVQQLESFTDSVVVRENDKPIGIVGGKDIIVPLVDNPSSSLFYETKVEDVMETRFLTVTKKSKLEEVINYWKETRRAFAAVPNEFSDYSALSAKKMLEVGTKVKTEISISQLPKKKIGTFDEKNTIGDVLNSMLEINARRLFLADSNRFINDRIILQKITDELKHGILSTTYHFPEIMINNITCDVHDSEAMCTEYKVVAVRIMKSKGTHKKVINAFH